MKVLIFDRKICTLNLLHDKLKKYGFQIIKAKNGSEFLNKFFSFDFEILIICKNELRHYNIDEKYFFKTFHADFSVYSYSHDENYIKNITQTIYKKLEYDIRVKIKKALLNCQRPGTINQDFIYKLPKKSGILLKQLMMKKEKGLSEKEIANLFWGQENIGKARNIYNHIYNLRKSLKEEFNDKYIIHRRNNTYMLLNMKNFRSRSDICFS